MDRMRSRDSRELSRRDETSRGSEKRNHEKRSSQKSRSRSRDRKRDRNGRRTSRSRSNDRKRDRGDKDDDRSRKSHRSDADKDHNMKRSNQQSNSNEASKSSNYEVVEDYDDSTLKEIEDFITEENVDEVQEAERLALERKLRREQILQKYNGEKTVSAPTATHLAQNNAAKMNQIIEQTIAAITGDDETLSSQVSAANSLAALVIAESKLISDHPRSTDNSTNTLGIITQPLAQKKTPEAIQVAYGSNNSNKRFPDPLEGEEIGDTGSSEFLSTSGISASSELGDLVPTLPTDITEKDEVLYDTAIGSNTTPQTNFLGEAEERLAEKSALRLDAHNHKESQPFDMFSSSPSDVERGAGKDASSKAWAGKRAMRCVTWVVSDGFVWEI
jgi:hypothetical protein